jgi:hypothetical protein
VQGGARVTHRNLSFETVHTRRPEVDKGNAAARTAAAPASSASSVQSVSPRTTADTAATHASTLPTVNPTPSTHAEAVGKLREIAEAEYPSIASVLEQAPPEGYTGSGIYVMLAGFAVRSVT